MVVEAPIVAYAAPASVEEAVQMLAAGDDAKVVAGCQSLGVFLRQGLIEPALLVGLKRIPELSAMTESPDGGLRIGAMVTQRTLEKSELVRERYPALADAAAL